jgi:hypothetical protein
MLLGRSAALFVLLLPMARAEDVESMQKVIVDIGLRPGWTLEANTEFRFNHNSSEFYSARGGPVLIWRARPRFGLLAGYYYVAQENVVRHIVDTNRCFGGVEGRLYDSRRMQFDGRFLYERNLVQSGLDYNRWRARLKWTAKRSGIRPFAFGEALYIHPVWFGRFDGGFMFPRWRGLQFAAGYEYRQTATPLASHIVYTQFQFDVRKPER